MRTLKITILLLMAVVSLACAANKSVIDDYNKRLALYTQQISQYEQHIKDAPCTIKTIESKKVVERPVEKSEVLICGFADSDKVSVAPLPVRMFITRGQMVNLSFPTPVNGLRLILCNVDDLKDDQATQKKKEIVQKP